MVGYTPRNDIAMAPEFALESAQGKKVSLSEFAGKWVVLEWWNHECPVVQRLYGAGNIQKLQAEVKAKGGVWLSICSSAPGKQGHVVGQAAQGAMTSNKGVPYAVLLDPTGEVGKRYQAKTTPHMFIVSPKGELVYDGAIDSNRSGNQPAAEVVPFFSNAFANALAGKPIENAKNRPYGCGVKYAN
jgi:peroxiredoxin